MALYGLFSHALKQFFPRSYLRPVITPFEIKNYIREYASLVGKQPKGIIDIYFNLGRPGEPIHLPHDAKPLTEEQKLDTLLKKTFSTDDEIICRSLIEAKKIKKSLFAHQYLAAVKRTKNGIPIPKELQPSDPTTVPEEGQTIPHLSYVYKRTGGRSGVTGRISVRHRGGGDRRILYVVDNKRTTEIPQKVLRIESQVRRSAKVALVQNVQGEPLVSYVLAHDGMKPGDILPNDNISPFPGNSLLLKNIPPGSFIYNIELYPGKGGQLVRSAGTRARLTGFDVTGTKALVELPSKKIKEISIECRATIGQASNPEWQNIILGKAGANRRLGWRPTVRGVAMNPVDHPHGGGKGGKSKGNLSQSPWGKLCK